MLVKYNTSTFQLVDRYLETSKADLFFVYFGDFIKMLDASDALSSRLRRKNEIQSFLLHFSHNEDQDPEPHQRQPGGTRCHPGQGLRGELQL